MTAIAETNRETWEDWIDPAQYPALHQLVTRDELVKRANTFGAKKVTANDLRYWENIGVIPKSIKKRHEGATRAVYPTWMLLVVMMLRSMQEAGSSLDEVRDAIRANYRKNADIAAVYDRIQGLFSDQQAFAINAKDFPLAATIIGRRFREIDSTQVSRVEIKIVGHDGRNLESIQIVVSESANQVPDLSY